MSHSTFKTAFWTMLLAFSLTILLTGLKPREIRQAARDAETSDESPSRNPDVAQRSKRQSQKSLSQASPIFEERLPQIPSEHSASDLAESSEDFLTASRQGQFEAVKAPLPPPMTGTRDSTPEKNKDVPFRPFRVASSDENQTLGLTDVSLPKRSLTRGPLLAPSSITVDQTKDLANRQDIVVPDPPGRIESDSAELVAKGVSELRQNVLKLRLAEAERELRQFREFSEIEEAKRLRSEIDRLRSSIEELRKKQAKLKLDLAYVPVATQLVPASASSEPQSPVEEKPIAIEATPRNIDVTPGETDGHIDFRFENVEIRRALEVISYHAKRRIVVEPEIEGRFTGELLDMEPKQAFATFIHTHGFGLSPKGSYLLVRRHRGR